jgi:hypothetical protein
MIKLHSRHCLVTAADGSVRSLDVEAVRRHLQHSFQACGMREDWSADHIALVIEEHASSRSGPEQPPLAEPDLHGMICTLLSASGFEDVSREYRARVPASAEPPDPDPFRPWDRARIEAGLQQVIPLDEDERAGIVARTEAALTALRLPLVRTELIRALGCHFMQDSAIGNSSPPPDSPWLLPPGGWPLGDVADAERLVRLGALRLLPVSRFLPRVRLELDLLRLVAVSGTPPLTEIVYLPALARCLDCIGALLTQVRRVVSPLLSPPRSPAAHLVVCGTEAAVSEIVPARSARAGKALQGEILGLIESRLPAGGAAAVLVTFRHGTEEAPHGDPT